MSFRGTESHSWPPGCELGVAESGKRKEECCLDVSLGLRSVGQGCFFCPLVGWALAGGRSCQKNYMASLRARITKIRSTPCFAGRDSSPPPNLSNLGSTLVHIVDRMLRRCARESKLPGLDLSFQC